MSHINGAHPRERPGRGRLPDASIATKYGSKYGTKPMRLLLVCLLLMPLTARAQVTETPLPPPGTVMPPPPSRRLPEPALAADSDPVAFLRAARGAIAAGRTGEAQAALEMAETRLLSRTVDAGREREPSDDLAVRHIADSIRALAARDRVTALRYIEFAAQVMGASLD